MSPDPQPTPDAVFRPRTPAVRMQDVCKRFGNIVANVSVNFTLQEGEIHALVGENGAGKTTLMNILYGLHHADSGRIEVFGREQKHHSPSEAIRTGIGMVHQHFMLVPTLTAAENVALGSEAVAWKFFCSRKRMEQNFEQLAAQFGFKVQPCRLVRNLSIGERQEVEIIKALSRDARIIILDEPTAVLTPNETERLFAIVRAMAKGGKSVVFITHKLQEVMNLAGATTVLRRGIVVASMPTSTTSPSELARLMVGSDRMFAGTRSSEFAVRSSQFAEACHSELRTPNSELQTRLLQVRGLRVKRDDGAVAVHGADLEVHESEIVALVGVEGNGQSELVEAIAGLRRVQSGEIRIAGQRATHAPTRTRLQLGMAYIPADRHRHGIIPEFDAWENCILGWHRGEKVGAGFRLSAKKSRSFALQCLAAFDVRPADPELPGYAFSGGNQQRLVVARELLRNPRLIIAAHPTRGLDVVSTDFVLRELSGERQAGKGILLVSSELEQVFGVSDRVLVMFSGRIAGEFQRREFDEHRIGMVMGGAGAKPN